MPIHLYIVYDCFCATMGEISYFINIVQITHKSYRFKRTQKWYSLGDKKRPKEVVELELSILPNAIHDFFLQFVFSQRAREVNNY